MINNLLLFSALSLCTYNLPKTDQAEVYSVYESIDFSKAKPRFEVFELAFNGYLELKSSGQLGDKHILTIVDFSLSSNQKRLWIIDVQKRKLIDHALVAHGRETGNEFAMHFSNQPNSHQSSLGFYITADIYQGKHGLSLNLIGVEEGINDKALERRIVIHGAEYVSLDFIEKHGRLGRSYGCPALSVKKAKKFIPLLADKTCLFIYYPNEAYFEKSHLVK